MGRQFRNTHFSTHTGLIHAPHRKRYRHAIRVARNRRARRYLYLQDCPRAHHGHAVERPVSPPVGLLIFSPYFRLILFRCGTSRQAESATMPSDANGAERRSPLRSKRCLTPGLWLCARCAVSAATTYRRIFFEGSSRTRSIANR